MFSLLAELIIEDSRCLKLSLSAMLTGGSESEIFQYRSMVGPYLSVMIQDKQKLNHFGGSIPVWITHTN